MTQEDKHLLLVDLCARLPYGIKCTTKLTGYNDVYAVQGVYEDTVFIDCPVYEEGDDEWMIESIIPFLRPMSSMTEEERDELKEICADYLDEWENAETVVDRWKLDAKTSYLRSAFYNSHHLDWNGLIEKGIALEAPEGMYSV